MRSAVPSAMSAHAISVVRGEVATVVAQMRARRARSHVAARGEKAHAHAGDDALREAGDVGPRRGQLGDQRRALRRQHAVDVVFDHVQAAPRDDLGDGAAARRRHRDAGGVVQHRLQRERRARRSAARRGRARRAAARRSPSPRPRARCPAGARLRAGRRRCSSSTSSVSPGPSWPDSAATSACCAPAVTSDLRGRDVDAATRDPVGAGGAMAVAAFVRRVVEQRRAARRVGGQVEPRGDLAQVRVRRQRVDGQVDQPRDRCRRRSAGRTKVPRPTSPPTRPRRAASE